MAERALSIADAVGVLQSAGVLAYPTEGVWGLGCDPLNQAAVIRLLAIKQRDIGKGLILIAASESQLAPFIDMSQLGDAQTHAVRASWPGPNTWIVPATADAPGWITGQHSGIAVRVSAHPEVVALCLAFGGALVSTSANGAGQPSPRHRDELAPGLIARIDGVLHGETGGREAPSVIRDAASGQVLRA
ncbi:MAG: Sua5/YciO/YrdC/YwlC family protein [Pseudomonadota bacterium]|nr:Sua5/YciO/YrdC/YwlC family protein [Pseudomonadota bacterium]